MGSNSFDERSKGAGRATRRRFLAGAVAGAAALAASRVAAQTGATQPGSAGQPAVTTDPRLAEAVARGATMEEIAKLREPVARNPADAVRALKVGNARFFSGQAKRPELSANERRAQILAQTPFAVVLGCSDSRVPIEIVFDQSLGDIFSIRVAGNIAEPATLGSIEYAVEHLKSHVVVVMGHEGCGAVKAAMLPEAQRSREPEHVRFLLERISPAVSALPAIRDEKARMREAVISNVRRQVQELKKNPVIVAAERRNQITVVGAFYEITSGAVDFLETAADLRVGARPRTGGNGA